MKKCSTENEYTEKLIIKTPNLQIIGPEQGEYQLSGIDFNFNKIINKIFAT